MLDKQPRCTSINIDGTILWYDDTLINLLINISKNLKTKYKIKDKQIIELTYWYRVVLMAYNSTM